MSSQSDFLFAQPSVTEGVGRILDFGDFFTEYNTSPTPRIADMIALQMDWRAVCYDLWAAINAFGHSHPHKEPAAAAAGD